MYAVFFRTLCKVTVSLLDETWGTGCYIKEENIRFYKMLGIS